ncbi:hypothetical protein J5289_01525 [Rhizobium sp. B230/85]|uniref:hypothetical protein n=1 Tax=unclassified Rhizobium TaxID=2613769 RepID=UPI001ADCC29C|nr:MULTISPECIES: hypothetical protein [unclassified Rhizobium]MBO9135517.1 hypothetical protein [Rhizobium sp. B209b/85]QXZ96321.1 hypothetical protein J5289_01525 [Rhizobium sp. B230/85]
MPDIYVSERVKKRHFLHVGPAIEAFVQHDAATGSVVKYGRADILIVAKDGDIYLMTKKDSLRAKIPFEKFDGGAISEIISMLNAD